MLRIIVHIQDCNDAANVPDARAVHKYKTFEIEAPEIERLLRAPPAYGSAQVTGVEIIDAG